MGGALMDETGPPRAAVPLRPGGIRRTDGRPPIGRPSTAVRPLVVLGALVAVFLLLLSARYGYHRDELYFLAAGRHPAWGYPDQGPVTPLLARLLSAVGPDSLVVLRVPSALIAGVVTVLTGVLARDLGAGRGGQLLAAACMAVSGGTLAVGHTLSTTTVDLLVWTLASVLVVRLLAGGDPRWWLAVGAVLGIGLENKWLPAFLAAALVVSLAAVGPRPVFRSPWLWVGAAVALLLWAPNLVWQAAHGWPQLALSRSIAAGGSTSSTPWFLFVPLELLFMSPVLVPIWFTGLWQLLGDARLRPWRAFGVAYLVLAALFLVTGGKPYYLLGMYPVLFAAAGDPVAGWARRSGIRRGLVAAAVVLSLLADSVIVLPVLPVRALAAGPVLAIYPDAGETVGWPAFAQEVAAVYRQAPAGAVLLMANYGEAGAVDRFGPELGLPRAYSGHNGYGLWGPPPDGATGAAVVVGYPEATLRQWFTRCSAAGTVDDGVGVDNQEQGRTVQSCTGQRLPWSRLWPSVVRLG
ncbi:hypothetical protein GCM10011594_17700 [Nakamurella endophytica]|uniref:Glycosyltransferase RgtA/B/C/D-like domain-containing protein n=1 Tax=Nakamurella endophytica TaxID=1748367 RepID=A0A917SVB6_9ACTN|nr:hypothetical protein GCM10011594_17700 [Nakamurella endophytica]